MECNLTMSAASVDGRPVLAELYIARTAWQRTRGLLGRSPLTDSQGLLIEKCHSVHMVGMKYAIDLCYLDQDGRVMKTIDNFKPWHFSYCLGANAVIEMMSGMNKRLNLSKGKKIEWS